jgi:pimeloyl-ACP methyl ester carboxylesterase
VAIYFSALSPILSDEIWAAHGVADRAIWVGFGIGSGAALAGLLLWPARRYRRLPFPTQPGERLLILLGVGALLGLARNLLIVGGEMPSDVGALCFVFQNVFQMLTSGILSVFYLLAILRTKILRWRLYFIAAAAAYMLGFVPPMLLEDLLQPTSRFWFPLVRTCPSLLGSLFLVGAILRDEFQGVRYRWPHWLGVIIAIWGNAMRIVWGLWWAFSGQTI